jgi:hypothetical protein
MKKTMLGIDQQLSAAPPARKNLLVVGALLSMAFATTQAYADTSPLDLTLTNDPTLTTGTINGAVFTIEDPVQPAGTGVIQSFLQEQQFANGTTERAINGTFTQPPGPAMDEGSSATFNHPILLSDIPTVEIEGVLYREFLLDLNEGNAQDDPFISLDQLKIFLADAQLAGSAYNEGTGTFNGANPIYDMSAGDPANWIELFDYNHGSGQSDMFAYIPNSLFVGANPYVYLFAAFGYQGGIWEANDLGTNAGFEEWATRGGAAPVPEPMTMLLFGTGLVGLAGARRRMSKQEQARV